MTKTVRVIERDDEFLVVVESEDGESGFDTTSLLFSSPAEEDAVHWARGLQYGVEHGPYRLKGAEFDLQ